jgi:hypothetical protein
LKSTEDTEKIKAENTRVGEMGWLNRTRRSGRGARRKPEGQEEKQSHGGEFGGEQPLQPVAESKKPGVQ